jgi:hypothetical protein
MNCQEFWNGEPHALDHLKDCRNCAARMENQSRLAVGLNALGAQMRRVEAPARVEQRLVSAYRAQTHLGHTPRGTVWVAVGAWAAALAATFLLAVFLIRGHQPQPATRMSHGVTQLAALEVPPDTAAPVGEDGFVRLPNAEDIAPNEPMNLVRVEVQRSAMIALGFSVSEEHASEPIEADVMLGPDGVARAVRFVEY